MKRYLYTVVIEKDEDGIYIASCPAIAGCYTQGDTYEEALENIKDAINLHIAARRDLVEPIPIETAIEETMSTKPNLDINGLRGVGKEIWKGMDAQDYINHERDAWT